VKPVIADLNAEYTAQHGMPRNASIVEMLTMLAPLAAGATAGSRRA
jgi:hypothetical protein